jgi:hypothetical protein
MILKKEAVGSAVTLGLIYETTLRYLREGNLILIDRTVNIITC